MRDRQSENILALSTAEDWLECIEANPVEDEIDAGLLRAVRGYITELRYRNGDCQPYASELDRLAKLKNSIRSLDLVYDELGSITQDVALLPDDMKRFFAFLTGLVMSLAGAINDLEAERPEWADYFAAERLMYSEWQAGRGPLAGESWFQDEGEHYE